MTQFVTSIRQLYAYVTRIIIIIIDAKIKVTLSHKNVTGALYTVHTCY